MSEIPGATVAGRPRLFLSALVGSNPRRLAWAVAVQVAAALSQGIGLLVLVPLLEVAGVGTSVPDTASGAAGSVRSGLRTVGAPLTLRLALAAYVALVALAAALGAYQSILSVRYRLEFVDGLRERLTRAIAAAQWRHLLGLRQPDLLTALTVDVNWVAQGTLATLNLGAAAVVISVQLAVAFRISPAVTGLALATGAVLAALAWPLAIRNRQLGRKLVEHNREVLTSVTAFMDGLKLAKALGLDDVHRTSFGGAITRARRCQIESARASAAATAIQLTVTAAVLAVLVGVSVGELGQPMAGLLVIAIIFTRVLGQLTQAQQNIQTLAQVLPSFGALMTVIRDCERAAEPGHALQAARTKALPRRPALSGRVTFDDVSFTYHAPGGTPMAALHRVSAEIPACGTTALVGPSGAGKTTMADLAVALLTPTSGRVLVDGAPLTGDQMSGWRESVAMVAQDPFVFHGTVRANLIWARPTASEDEMWRALAMASAEEFVRRLPGWLDAPVGDRGSRLSGGERQRIALARALLRRPRLLVLDEPTSALDAGNEAAILDALAALRGQATVLVISHRESVMHRADQVIWLARGRVTGIGVPAGTMADDAPATRGADQAVASLPQH